MVLGTKTGLWISELLSVQIGDALDERGRFRPSIYVRSSAMKGKTAGRRLPLSPSTRGSLGRWLVQLRRTKEILRPDWPLFSSREGDGLIALSRKSAHRIYANAAEAARLEPGISTHSCRKWVSREVYARSEKCLITTGTVLGHRSIKTTWRYCLGLTTEVNKLLVGI